MTTLQEVKAWLATLKSGTTVNVSSSLFDAKLVNALFALLPDKQPIALSITAVDADKATLSGTAMVLGEADTSATFTFTQPASDLLLELALMLPPGVEWTLLSDFKVAFGALGAKLVPDAELGVVGLAFDATIKAGASGEVSIPVEFSVPTFDGDWHLSGSFTSIGSLTADALTALAGNESPTSILPSQLSDITKFQLTAFEVAFNPSKRTCTLIRVGIGYCANWQFFGDLFEVVGIDLDFAVLDPFGDDRSLQAELDAKMKIGTTPFEVGGRFPDKSVFAHLSPGGTLNVTDALTFLHVPLPAGFPAIEISTLSFVFFTANDAFDFQLGIDKPVPIIGDAKLDNFFFEIGATYDSDAKKVLPSGNLQSAFSIGKTKLLLGGTYSTAGVTLEGEVDDVKIRDVVAKLASDFKIDSVPAPIEKLTLETARVRLDTEKQKFSFMCDGKTSFAGVDVEFKPKIELTYASGAFGADFHADLILETAAKKKLEFGVTFSTTHADTWMTAEYKGTALELADLASALHFPLPDIPHHLDLGLTAIGFFYDFTGGILVVGAKSDNYGDATLASMAVDGKRQFYFVLDTGQSFSLSNLPLVGHELAQIENVSISDLQTIIATAKADKDTAGKINKEIAKLKSANYPKLPDAGTTGTFVLSAKVDVGSHPLPLSVSLGGGGSKELVQDVAAAAGGPTWFDVQKSFGPVTIQRIGVMYESGKQTLWFELDASLAFGPLGLDLVGLGIGSPLTSFKPAFSLQGLGVAFSKPPLEIAGGLVNLAPPGAEFIEFEGGLTIGTSQFKLTAFGYYGNSQGFSSMFIFGDIGYPFGGPPAFFVTGLALGFGYNSSLRIPTIDEVGEFPFVVVLPTAKAPDPNIFGPNPTPVKVLEVIQQKKWVTPKAGSLWFAAGITFTSFELVTGQALLLVEVGADELVIALVGIAGAQFPQFVDESSGAVFANVELDILIRFAPMEGVFSAQAVLSKSSFVLDKACVLTGGFAFFIWFGSNPHAGDFVLTVGGYNPGYTPPAHYPAVPAVGFHWSLDDSITVSGGAYLAVTPAVLMAGGRLDATYQTGNLKAWFDAHADILIRWKPFWIDAEIGITVGASYKIDLAFTSFTVSVELGCDLEIYGPPTGGSVTVDWYIISFTIPFGASKDEAPTIKGWTDIEAMLPNTSPPKKPRNVVALTPSDGLIPTTTKPPSDAGLAAAAGDGDSGPSDWTVRASHFAFETTTSIPATAATVGSTHAFNGDKFDVHPLGWKDVSSTYGVAITDKAGADMSASFEAARTTHRVPASLWGAPPESADGPQVPDADEQLVDGQLTGVSIQVLPPEIGATAGAIDVEAHLSSFDLELPGATLPLSGSAQPSGDVPVNDPGTVARIADKTTGIASTTVTATRGAIYSALLDAKYVPAGNDDPLGDFADGIDCALAAEPLMVP